MKLTIDRYEASRGLFATAELFVITAVATAPTVTKRPTTFLTLLDKKFFNLKIVYIQLN